MTSAYIKGLKAEVAARAAAAQARRAEQERADLNAARLRLTPLQDRLARLLNTTSHCVVIKSLR